MPRARLSTMTMASAAQMNTNEIRWVRVKGSPKTKIAIRRLPLGAMY